MKLKNIIAAALFVLTAGTATAQNLSYKVEGNISGLPDGAVVVLTPVSTVMQQPIDSATVSGGKFALSGKVNELTGARLMVKGAYGSMPLILGDGDVLKLDGKVSTENLGGTLNYNYEGVTATGSPWTTRYIDALSVRGYLDLLYKSNNEVFKDYTAQYGKARMAKNKALCDSLSRSPLGVACGRADSIFFKVVEDAYHKVTMKNRDNFLGPLSMVSLFAYLTPELRTWYDEFTPEAKNSQYGKMVKKDVAPDTNVGKQAPAFTLKNDKGKTVTLKDLAKGKKYILIDFWASWCQPCRKEIPNVKAQYAKYKNKGLEVVSISIDTKDAAWRKALAEEKLQWPNFRDADGTAQKAWEVKFVPTMYLVDANGKIVAENARGEFLAKKLAELFK